MVDDAGFEAMCKACVFYCTSAAGLAANLHFITDTIYTTDVNTLLILHVNVEYCTTGVASGGPYVVTLCFCGPLRAPCDGLVCTTCTVPAQTATLLAMIKHSITNLLELAQLAAICSRLLLRTFVKQHALGQQLHICAISASLT